MISKEFRLGRTQINYILKKGDSFNSALFILKYLKNDEQNCRFCVIISRKVSTKATDRNRLKRQIFECIRLTLKENTPKVNLDMILIPKKIIMKKTQPNISEDIKNILNKLN